MHRDGVTVSRIAQSLGVSRTTVYNLLEREFEPPAQRSLFDRQ